jgi:glucose-1-phosphate thymidylyltransferase
VDVILPVAGLGSRLRPQTWTKPKPLVSVAGKPMLAHVIDRVLPVEPDSIIFITGFLGDQIESWARETLDVPVAFVEQLFMRGQTDAILKARDLAQKDALILFPDMLFEADFSGLPDVDADVVMFTKIVEDPSALGVAVVEDDRITKLVEKPQELISNLAVIGIYYFKDMSSLYTAIEEQMERGISLKNEFFIADAIQIMIDRGARVVPRTVTAWEDCGSVPNLLSTNRYILDRISTSAPSATTSVIVEPSIVAEDAILEYSIIGPYASIGKGSVVRHSRVQNSVLEERAIIENSRIDASIVGRRARVTEFSGSVNIGDDGSVQA